MTTSSDRRERFLEEMGIGPTWTLRERASSLPSTADAAPAVMPEAEVPVIDGDTLRVHATDSRLGGGEMADTKPSAEAIMQMGWPALKAAVSTCTKCDLCRTRTQTVFGTGDEKAKWLFVGEGPGRNEDLRGEPFIGAAGKLLDNMLAAMGLKRGENAYIANIVKCRPTDDSGRDRPPTPEEASACLPYLERQIALIQPDIIVALGKTAALSLLGADPSTPVSKLRGIVHRHGTLPLVVTYHPAYLLRKLDDKAKAWRDLCLAMSTYAGNADAV